MKKRDLESILFLVVICIVFLGVRHALAGVERTPHIYEYEETMHVEKEQRDVIEKVEEVAKREEEKEKKQDTHKEQPKDQKEKSDSSDTSHNSHAGGNGKKTNGGKKGKGKSDKDDVKIEEPLPSASPSPSQSPTVAPTVKPTVEPTVVPSTAPGETATPTPKDEIISITCEWPDKDKVEYGKTIPDESIEVKAVYLSGKTETLSKSKYTIIGLNNKVCGKRQMTILYKDFDYTMTYTVNNYMVGIDYDWENKDKCYRGEIIDDDELWVYAVMADGTEEDIEYGDYLLTGIDSECIGVKQKFTISYEGYKVTGTCTFHDYNRKSITEYYEDAEYEDFVSSKEGKLEISNRKVVSKLNETIKMDGKTYIVKEQTLVIDGVKKSISTRITERDFNITMTYRCVLKE